MLLVQGRTGVALASDQFCIKQNLNEQSFERATEPDPHNERLCDAGAGQLSVSAHPAENHLSLGQLYRPSVNLDSTSLHRRDAGFGYDLAQLDRLRRHELRQCFGSAGGRFGALFGKAGF